MGGTLPHFYFKARKHPLGGGTHPYVSSKQKLGKHRGGYPPKRGTPPIHAPKVEKSDMLQSRRPERPRSSRDHHSKPLGAIYHSSASTFSASATIKSHPDHRSRDPGSGIPDPGSRIRDGVAPSKKIPLRGRPELPELPELPEIPDPAAHPFNGGVSSPHKIPDPGGSSAPH